jgi:DNA-binding response OmpR family regulator
MTKVLVIDDMHGIANLMQSILTDYDYDVDVAYNGREGTKLIESNKYDLVLTDIIMPEKDGFDVVNVIKDLTKETSIIAMTGGGVTISAPVALAALESKVDATLKKPVSKEELLSCVKTVLDKRKN